ncbi:MAG: patatin-like phospholipase family protein [Colwellia sp.]|nr:patatin-like phospholipase family protein [Colwellia sp.]
MRAIILLIILYYSCSFSVVGAEKTVQERPKIGLVLSGGGAKGAAHIGVLKVLEQHHIPIDYVVGTSIGAYVGGLYALGYQADQIENIMLNLPWDESYSDFIPRESLSLKDKNHRDQYNISLRLGYSDGQLKAPSGLLLGQSAGNLLKLSTDVVAKIESFDDLAIPYRAIAANLATAKAVVIKQGSITKAMRASTAVPGVVEPVNIDGQLLVDGGIANNMPIDVVKTMGADIVIAVDIGSPLLTKAEINDTIDVFNQLSTILTNNTTLAQLKYLSPQDVLIRPKIDNLSTTDFAVMPEALALGEKSALLAKEKLTLLSVSQQEYFEYQQQKQHKKRAWFDGFTRPIVEIEYQNHSQMSTTVIKENFAITIGEVVTKEQLQLAINRVYALNEFEHVDAEFIDLPNGRKLIVVTKPKSWGPNYLSFGFNLQTDFSYRTIFALDFAYTQNDINPYGGKWLNEAKIGWEFLVASEFYQPLVKEQHYFSRARLEYVQDKWEPTLERPELTNEYFKANFGLGYNYTINGVVEFGLIGEQGDLSFNNVQETSLDYDSLGGYLSFDYDNLNSMNFPTQGNKFSFNVYWRNENYQEFEGISPKDTSVEATLDWRGALSFKNHAFVGIASFATVDNKTDFSVHVTELGGFLNLSGYQKDALIGSHKAFVAVVYQYDLGRELFGEASLPLYLGTSVEAGNIWTLAETVKADDIIKSGSLYLGTDTSFGPAVFGVGFASGGRNSVFLSLGKSF